MSYTATDAQRAFFLIQCRMDKTIGFNKAAFARMSIAHARRLGLTRAIAFWEGVLAHEAATSAQERADASDRIAGALMLSSNEAVREHAREQLRGFVACGAMRAQASVRVADALIAELAKVQS